MAAILNIGTEWLSNSESPLCLQSSFRSIWFTVWEKMCFEFQDGPHLVYWNRMILAILIFSNAQCLPSSLSSIRLTVPEQMWFEDFQDGCHGGHLGYLNGTILAILNLHTAPMPSTKFPLHLANHIMVIYILHKVLRKYLSQTVFKLHSGHKYITIFKVQKPYLVK